jgi:hypothetical protein
MSNNADLIARAHEEVLIQYEQGQNIVASLLAKLANTLDVQDKTIADLRQRAEGAEAGLRKLMDITMKQLPNEQWEVVEPVVRDVKVLSNPRAEVAEARIMKMAKTITALQNVLEDVTPLIETLRQKYYAL